MKLGSSQQILVKYSHVKFHKNPSSESRVIPRVRTDRLDEDKSRYSQHFEILLEFQSFSKFRKTLKVTSKYHAFMPNGPDIIAKKKYSIYFERPR